MPMEASTGSSIKKKRGVPARLRNCKCELRRSCAAACSDANAARGAPPAEPGPARAGAARADVVVCGDKSGAGRTAWAYVCAYLLDGRAATSDSSDCDSPAPETTTSTTELPRPRAVCPRAHSGCEYEFFFTYSAPLPTTCFGTPRTGCPSVFIGLRFR